MKQEWFTAKELSELRLPGFVFSKRHIANAFKAALMDRPDLSRVRKVNGGTAHEFHYTLLPDTAQAELVGRYTDAPKPDEAEKARGAREARNWAWFDRQTNYQKDAAKQRQRLLLELCARRREVFAAEAVNTIAAKNGVSAATIYNWLDAVKGLDRSEWLPALAPAKRGGDGKPVDIDANFLDAFKADYLRASQPSFTSSYDRTCDIAKEQGWAIPNIRTLRRRIKKVDPVALVYARKGRDAVKAMFPAQRRDTSMFHALEAVNVDGHKWDDFVLWPDDEVRRPMMIAFQDLYSGMFLAWRICPSENKHDVRLCFGELIKRYGIPLKCYFDNGRAFASKWITGGTPNRYRFKVKEEEPDGVMTQLGVEIHWTMPYAGQSKPIERAFGEFADTIAKHPAFEGAYTGNKPGAKPENYGTKAIPLAEFTRVVSQQIARHNARIGRERPVCQGKFSFQEVFDASYAASPIRKATAEQIRMCMLMSERVKPRGRDGTIHLHGNRYWNERLLGYRKDYLHARFDPEHLHQDLAIYALDGTFICMAEAIADTGFNDVEAAKVHAKNRNAFIRAGREMTAAERKMSLAQLVALQPKAADYQPPETKVVRPIFQSTGNLALKPAANAEAEAEDFDMNFAKGLRLVRGGEREF